jgi:hypothetical protein
MYPVYHFRVNLKHSRAEALSVCGRGGGAAGGTGSARNTLFVLVEPRETLRY